jgi:hypothetical protein
VSECDIVVLTGQSVETLQRKCNEGCQRRVRSSEKRTTELGFYRRPRSDREDSSLSVRPVFLVVEKPCNTEFAGNWDTD